MNYITSFQQQNWRSDIPRTPSKSFRKQFELNVVLHLKTHQEFRGDQGNQCVIKTNHIGYTSELYDFYEKKNQKVQVPF